LRNSPSVLLVEKLIKNGREVIIYDRNLIFNKFIGRNKEFILSSIPFLEKILVKKIEDLFDKTNVLVLMNYEHEYLEAIKRTKNLKIIDFVGLEYFIREKHEYYGINW